MIFHKDIHSRKISNITVPPIQTDKIIIIFNKLLSGNTFILQFTKSLGVLYTTENTSNKKRKLIAMQTFFFI